MQHSLNTNISTASGHNSYSASNITGQAQPDLWCNIKICLSTSEMSFSGQPRAVRFELRDKHILTLQQAADNISCVIP